MLLIIKLRKKKPKTKARIVRDMLFSKERVVTQDDIVRTLYGHPKNKSGQVYVQRIVKELLPMTHRIRTTVDKHPRYVRPGK